MAQASTSSLDITDDRIVSSPVSLSPFIPGSANLFPKLPTHINSDSWELWEFDAFSTDGETALGLSLYRDTRGFEKGGFHAEVNALWPDGKKWSETLYFATSTINEESDGRVHGVWKSKISPDLEDVHGMKERSIGFTISPDCTVATVLFSVPGQVEGSLLLCSSSAASSVSRLPKTELEAQLCPNVFYMFPMGPVVAEGCLTISFPSNAELEQRNLSFSVENGGRGGMVRGWSNKPWPAFMNDAYYVVAHVGPYQLQILRILGSVFAQHKPRAVARLYHNDDLVCAANQMLDPSSKEGQREPETQDSPLDTVWVTKVLPNGHEQQGLAGEFRDKNIGYTIELFGADQRKHWKFEIRHKRALWSEPTSAPGESGTGKSGWIEDFSGGLEGEQYSGLGLGGQLQIPVP